MFNRVWYSLWGMMCAVSCVHDIEVGNTFWAVILGCCCVLAVVAVATSGDKK